MSSFVESVRRNQFSATRKHKILHRTVKAAVLDISTSFRAHLWGNPTLVASGQSSISLQQQLQGYKSMEHPVNHQKVIPSKMVFRICKKQYSRLSIAIGQMIGGAFFFGMQACEYYTTTKRWHKRTRILRKGEIKLYRKRRELPNSSGRLHLSDKVSPIFRTHNMGSRLPQ